jgi:predicted enzyme related to lactoylglutathione lyase
MFKKLRTIIYHVQDITAAKEWYTKATGITPYFDHDLYVGFDINGYELGLDGDAAHVTTGNQTVAYWAVDDIDSSVAKLVSIGGTVFQPAINVGGTIIVAVVEDPFGNHVGLIQGA